MPSHDLELIAQAIASLRQAEKELPEDQRQILRMHRVERLTQEEIALRLGIDALAVERKLCEAITRLDRALFKPRRK